MVVVVVASTTIGCSMLFKQYPDISAEKYYMHDMRMEINGKVFNGVAVPPKSESYEIKIFPADERIDRLTFTSCGRYDQFDKAVTVKGHLFWKKKDEFFKYSYKPSPKVELNRTCNMKIGAFESKKKRMSYGLIVFSDVRENVRLSSEVVCNGEEEIFAFGKSACQSAPGLMQRIEFKTPVFTPKTNQKPECLALMTEDLKPYDHNSAQKVFFYKMPVGDCTWIFTAQEKSLNGNRMRHDHTSFGFEDVPPPEEVTK